MFASLITFQDEQLQYFRSEEVNVFREILLDSEMAVLMLSLMLSICLAVSNDASSRSPRSLVSAFISGGGEHNSSLWGLPI